MKEPRNYPDIMMKGVLAANGYDLPIQPTDEQRAFMGEAHACRAAEDAASVVASIRYYTLTARGRLAAERVDAAARAQLERTKETT